MSNWDLDIYGDNPAILTALQRRLAVKHTVANVNIGDTIEDAKLLVIDVSKIGYYVGCPNCFSALKVPEGIATVCTSQRCNGKSVIAKKFDTYTLVAGDTKNIVYLSLRPFGFMPKNVEEVKQLIGKEVIVNGSVRTIIKTRTYGQVPIILIRSLKVVREIFNPQAKNVELPKNDLPQQSPSTTQSSTLQQQPISAEKLAIIKTIFKIEKGKLSKVTLEKYLQSVGLSIDSLRGHLNEEGDSYIWVD